MVDIANVMNQVNKFRNARAQQDLAVKSAVDKNAITNMMATGNASPDAFGLGNDDILSKINDNRDAMLNQELARTKAAMAAMNNPQNNPNIGTGVAQNQPIAPIQTNGSAYNPDVISKMNNSIADTASKNLKYSQGRGAGCTDCSAFTRKVMKDATGKDIGGNTEAQWKNGISIAPGSAKQGDMVYFLSPKMKKKNRNVSHVGILNGDGTMTHFGINGLQTRTPLKGYSLPMVGVRRF